MAEWKEGQLFPEGWEDMGLFQKACPTSFLELQLGTVLMHKLSKSYRFSGVKTLLAFLDVSRFLQHPDYPQTYVFRAFALDLHSGEIPQC